jgi:electron transport complex protein RnfC
MMRVRYARIRLRNAETLADIARYEKERARLAGQVTTGLAARRAERETKRRIAIAERESALSVEREARKEAREEAAQKAETEEHAAKAAKLAREAEREKERTQVLDKSLAEKAATIEKTRNPKRRVREINTLSDKIVTESSHPVQSMDVLQRAIRDAISTGKERAKVEEMSKQLRDAEEKKP